MDESSCYLDYSKMGFKFDESTDEINEENDINENNDNTETATFNTFNEFTNNYLNSSNNNQENWNYTNKNLYKDEKSDKILNFDYNDTSKFKKQYKDRSDKNESNFKNTKEYLISTDSEAIKKSSIFVIISNYIKDLFSFNSKNEINVLNDLNLGKNKGKKHEINRIFDNLFSKEELSYGQIFTGILPIYLIVLFFTLHMFLTQRIFSFYFSNNVSYNNDKVSISKSKQFYESISSINNYSFIFIFIFSKSLINLFEWIGTIAYNLDFNNNKYNRPYESKSNKFDILNVSCTKGLLENFEYLLILAFSFITGMLVGILSFLKILNSYLMLIHFFFACLALSLFLMIMINIKFLYIIGNVRAALIFTFLYIIINSITQNAGYMFVSRYNLHISLSTLSQFIIMLTNSIPGLLILIFIKIYINIERTTSKSIELKESKDKKEINSQNQEDTNKNQNVNDLSKFEYKSKEKRDLNKLIIDYTLVNSIKVIYSLIILLMTKIYHNNLSYQNFSFLESFLLIPMNVFQSVFIIINMNNILNFNFDAYKKVTNILNFTIIFFLVLGSGMLVILYGLNLNGFIYTIIFINEVLNIYFETYFRFLNKNKIVVINNFIFRLLIFGIIFLFYIEYLFIVDISRIIFYSSISQVLVYILYYVLNIKNEKEEISNFRYYEINSINLEGYLNLKKIN